MRKIVFVIESLRGGGAERVTAALANELCADTQNEIHLITYVHEPELEYSLDHRIHRHVCRPTSDKRIKRFFERCSVLKKQIIAIRPDCVISLGSPGCIISLTFAMVGSAIPLILSERNDPRNYPKRKLTRVGRSFSYRLCDGIVFQTEGAKNYFSKSIQKKGTVICNPLTEGLPLPYEGNRASKIVNWCRLTPQKNLDLLIDAFSDIAAEFPSHSLYIYGEGAERNHLEEKIALMNMDGRIFLPGYSTRIHEEILDAALFVSSSDYEGISNSMLEALSLGIPTVCTDCPPGGARETIDHGINGLLVPVGDRVAMAEAIRGVLRDPSFAQKLSHEGVGLREKISVSAITQQWVAFMEKVAAPKRRKHHAKKEKAK